MNLLLSEEVAQPSLLCLVVYCEHACDGLPDHLDLRELGRRTPSHLRYPKLSELILQLLELLEQLGFVLRTKLVDLDWGVRKIQRERSGQMAAVRIIRGSSWSERHVEGGQGGWEGSGSRRAP